MTLFDLWGMEEENRLTVHATKKKAEVQQLRDLGAKDIILDPGFGFGKNLIQNYQLQSYGNDNQRLHS